MNVKLTPKHKRKNPKRRLYGHSSSRFNKNIPILAQLERAIKQLTPSWQACIPLAILIVLVWVTQQLPKMHLLQLLTK